MQSHWCDCVARNAPCVETRENAMEMKEGKDFGTIRFLADEHNDVVEASIGRDDHSDFIIFAYAFRPEDRSQR